MANLERTLPELSPAGLHPERELTEPVPLCDSKGRLLQTSVGWSRHPLHTCNLSGHWPRKKRWNFWGITNDTCCFSVLLADMDYTGLAKAYFLEYETKRFIEQTVTLPLGRGCDLPETANRDVVFESKAMSLSFLDEQGDTRVRVQSPAFGGTTLSAELLVERPKGHETINVVIPWSAARVQPQLQADLPSGQRDRLARGSDLLLRAGEGLRLSGLQPGHSGPIGPSGTGPASPARRAGAPSGSTWGAAGRTAPA